MTRNPYTVLGIPSTASQDQIKRALRTLAKELHPDVNPGDADAEARLREVIEAYAFLSDPQRRARFDRGEINAQGMEQAAVAAMWQAYCDPMDRLDFG